MIDDERSNLLTFATDTAAARDLLDDADDYQLAGLLRGLLELYGAAARAVCTDLGILCIGVALEEITESPTDPDQAEAARLILAFDAARDTADNGSAFRDSAQAHSTPYSTESTTAAAFAK